MPRGGPQADPRRHQLLADVVKSLLYWYEIIFFRMCENTEEIYKNATRRKRETVVENGPPGFARG